MTQKVKILYFASARDITNTESDEIEIESHYTLENLSRHLILKYGKEIEEILSISMYAVNMEYVPKHAESVTILEAGTEVAIVPPIDRSLFRQKQVDTIKTRIQTNRDTYMYTLLTPEGKLEKVISLYRGISITLLFSVPALTVYLTVYASIKSRLNYLELPWFRQEDVLNHAISGLLAEAAAGVFFTPMEVIKSQLQISNHFTTWSLMQHVAKQEGLAGFYRGYWITLGVFIPHSITYFVVYEYLKSFYTNPTLMAYILCAAAASTVGIVVSTPLDIIKTRWQVSSQEQCYQEGPVKIAIHMWQREGKYLAFTQGLTARVFWGIPLTTINMVVFELLLNAL